MAIPPGILYLSRTFIYAIPPVGVTYLFFAFVLEHAFPTLKFDTLIRSAVVLTSVVAYPWIMFGWRNYVDWTEARRRGAVLIPKVYDPLPGGLGLTKTMVNNFKAGYVGDVFEEWRQELGNVYRLNLLSDRRVITFEPDHIKAILATQFDTFDKGPALFDQFKTLLGVGVFNSDGDMWKFHRSMTRPFFSRDRITDFDPIFDAHALAAIAQAKTRLSQGYPIDFQDLVSRFTLDSATAFLCGESVDSISAGLPFPHNGPHQPPMEIAVRQRDAHLKHRSTRFVEAFLDAQHMIALRTRYGPAWPLMSGEFWEDKVESRRKIVDAFVEPFVKTSLEKVQGGEKMDKDDESVTLLDHMVAETQDMQILKDEVVNLLVAARDTTASLLTFSLYMLTEHPDVADKLRAEIGSIMGPGNSRPTNEQIKDMKYLRAFLNEVLRLYPPVPFDSRASNKAALWPTPADGPTGGRPYYIPPNTKAGYGVFLMHRREDLWGPDAAIFDPERFIDQRLAKYLTPNPFIFLPFNAGPRICLGQQFAYYEASFFLIRLLQQFGSFDLAQESQPPESVMPKEWKGQFKGSKGVDKVWPGTHLTMYARGGLWVTMKEGELPVPDI